MMQKSQVLHNSENGGNPGTSMMHNSDAQSEHDLRLRARLIQRAGSGAARSEEHTSELQSLMRISYAVFCLKKKKSILTIQTLCNRAWLLLNQQINNLMFRKKKRLTIDIAHNIKSSIQTT